MDDRTLALGWYRFNSSGGWKIPETAVTANHCSGQNPGWLLGAHPSVGDGAVTRPACFGYNCPWHREIRVKNCAGYFVYWLSPSPITYGVYCTATDSALGDPCVTHTVLDQPWRSTDCSNTECSAGTWMSDRYLAVGWYRFNSSGGWKIPETVVPMKHCSGELPGWLVGAHPSVGDGEVTRTACFNYDGHICNWNRGISVKNCSGYFVYQLWPSPHSYGVYCTATDSAPNDPCVTHTVLDQPWRSTDCSNTECSAGTWMDDGNLAVGWYRFNSSGGWKIPETVVPVNHCSGQYPGWLVGAHPSVGDGEVTRAVCFNDGSYICNWTRVIRVKNCTGYFVYWLRPSPTTYGVYCTDPASVPTEEPPETTAEPRSTASEPDTCSGIDGGIIGTSYFLQSSTSAGKEWDLQTSTREQGEGSPTGETTQEPSSVPAGDTSSDLQTSTREQGEGSLTGESTQEPSSVPAGDTSSDLQTSTREQGEGSPTGETTQEPSSVPAGDTSSDEDYQMIEIKVTSDGEMTVEEVKEALRAKLQEMFDDPDPQIELVMKEEEDS